MSALTLCNRCSLDAMERRAAKRGAHVVVQTVPASDPMAGWISARYEDHTEPSAYFAAITDECACHT